MQVSRTPHLMNHPLFEAKQFPGQCELGIVLRLAIRVGRRPSVDTKFELWPPADTEETSEGVRENVGRTVEPNLGDQTARGPLLRCTHHAMHVRKLGLEHRTLVLGSADKDTSVVGGYQGCFSKQTFSTPPASHEF